MSNEVPVNWIEKEQANSFDKRECQLIEKIVGDFGDDDAFLTILLTDEILRSRARSELEDKALALKANTIEIVDNREFKKQLKTRLGLFKVEIAANAYHCEH